MSSIIGDPITFGSGGGSITIDSTPTAGSTNAVSSGGVFTELGRAFCNKPRYKDITGYFTDGTLWNRIAGTGYPSEYYDIMPGDYFSMGRHITCPDHDTSLISEGSEWVTVLSCGGFYGTAVNSYNYLNYPHLIMAPGKGNILGEEDEETGSILAIYMTFGFRTFHSGSIKDCGYKDSDMNTAIIGPVVSAGSVAEGATINQQLYYVFESHLKQTTEFVTESIDTSTSKTSTTNIQAQACLMTEYEVFGGQFLGVGNADETFIMHTPRHLDLFAMDPSSISGKEYPWIGNWYLRTVGGMTYGTDEYTFVSTVISSGPSEFEPDQVGEIWIRPRFIIA